MEVKVKISEDDSRRVESLWFENNSILDVIKYLAGNGVSAEQFVIEYNAKRKELETAKKEVSFKYQPDKEKAYKYTFDFDNQLIIYEEIK